LKKYSKNSIIRAYKQSFAIDTKNTKQTIDARKAYMGFFPDEVKVESTSRYTRFDKGTTTLRFLGKPVFYNETWIEVAGERKPKRFPLGQDVPLSECGPDGVKQVMSIKVYNHNEKAIQVCSISQKTILKAVKNYSMNPKYGDPTGYDINVEKTGEGKQTRYNVIADPKEELSKAIVEADKANPVDLNKLLTNDDPFTSPVETEDIPF